MKKVLSLVLLAALAIPGFAQGTAQSGSSGSGGSLTIEELFLSQEVEIQVLRTQALGNTRSSKLLALQNIRDMVSQKRVSGDNREIITILDALAGEGVYRVTRSNGAVVNDFPDVRREAVQLLGQIGGPAVKEILLKVSLEDKETMVLSEAIYAIGQTASENDKDVLPIIAKVLQRNNVKLAPDNNLAFACLLTIERLAAKFKGIGDPDIVTALLDVAYGVYLKEVRDRALRVIQKLRPSNA